MKFKNKEDLGEVVSEIGYQVVSKFSSIRALAKMGIPLQGMLQLENLIRQIECTCWSIMPLGLELKREKEKFEAQIKHLDDLLVEFKNAASAMAELSKVMSDNSA